MKQIKLFAILLIASTITFTSCSKDNNDCQQKVEKEKTNAKTVTIKTVAIGSQDDPAKQTGDFVKFSFKEGKIVTSDDWDFAVRGRLILTNGRSKYGKDAGLVFGKGEPKRTKEVKVIGVIGEFEGIKNVGGFVGTDWHMDYDYAKGFQSPLAPAISFASNTSDAGQTRQPWHLRSSRTDGKDLFLRPVVFIFQTQDGKVAKMVIEKMDRTNTDFDKKEEITYTIKYYYNANGISLDEKK
ncbi:MAG: hypothetical protein KGV44_03490 [Flavobacteriaceae bacterium]|nr:hypothetical protein [Flavobacteriaceae bacterium]